MARKYLDDFNKNLDWAISGVKHQVMQDVSVNLSINQVCRICLFVLSHYISAF